MDQATLNLLNQMHPKVRNLAISCYTRAVHETPVGVHPVIDATLRSLAESERLWFLGRNAAGQIIDESKVVTWAVPGHSWHNYGLALDFHLVINGHDYWPATREEALKNANWMKVVEIFELSGFNSGLDFPEGETDAPHLEIKMGQTISGLLAKYHAKNFIPGTTYVNF